MPQSPPPFPLPHSVRSIVALTSNTAVLLATLLLSPSAHADATATPPGLPTGAILQGFLGLALVLGLIVAIAFFMRRLPNNRAFAQNAMKVVGGIAIGPRERVVLLEVGDCWVLIGLAPGQMRTLHTLPKGEITAAAEGAQPPFSQWLRHFVDQHKKNDPA